MKRRNDTIFGKINIPTQTFFYRSYQMYLFKGFNVNESYQLSLQGVMGMDSIEGQSKSNIVDAKLIWG